MATIEIRDLTKRYGPVLAVDRLSFEVERGTVTGFLGPNGAGKTTTLRMLLGLVEPTAGGTTINGAAYRDVPDPLHQVGAVLEASSFHPGRTARNHLRVQALAGGIRRARVEEVLDLVGLGGAADRRVGGFSLGMRQRLGLATALLGDPEVLILDEPTNGLDPEGVRWIRGLIRGLAEQGRTVLVSSHLLAEVARRLTGS
jgi:ABC-2 type transport system ATP-binding protein